MVSFVIFALVYASADIVPGKQVLTRGELISSKYTAELWSVTAAIVTNTTVRSFVGSLLKPAWTSATDYQVDCCDTDRTALL